MTSTSCSLTKYQSCPYPALFNCELCCTCPSSVSKQPVLLPLLLFTPDLTGLTNSFYCLIVLSSKQTLIHPELCRSCCYQESKSLLLSLHWRKINAHTRASCSAEVLTTSEPKSWYNLVSVQPAHITLAVHPSSPLRHHQPASFRK